MLDNKQIFEESLVNHLYFAGTIRSFCITIGLTFFKNNQDYIDRAIDFGYRATDITNKAIIYMNKELANAVLENNVYITEYTKQIDLLTERLFDINLQIGVDKDIELLTSRGNVLYNEETMKKIDELNNESLILINEFKGFCQEIKKQLDEQELFSYLYPDFFNYMYDEISVYGRDIERILSKKDYTNFYLSEYTYYFNNLLKESALYIRGFLDTIHQDIFDMASFYINAFNNLIEKYLKGENDISLNIETEKMVLQYKSFVSKIIQDLLTSKVYYITPPVVLDNFLTNINVYLYIIKYVDKIKNNVN